MLHALLKVVILNGQILGVLPGRCITLGISKRGARRRRARAPGQEGSQDSMIPPLGGDCAFETDSVTVALLPFCGAARQPERINIEGLG